MRKTIEALLDLEVSATKIAIETGLSVSKIQELKADQKEIGKLSLEDAEKLYESYRSIMNNIRIRDIYEKAKGQLQFEDNDRKLFAYVTLYNNLNQFIKERQDGDKLYDRDFHG